MKPLPVFLVLTPNGANRWHGVHQGKAVQAERGDDWLLIGGAGQTVELTEKEPPDRRTPSVFSGQGPTRWVEASMPPDVPGLVVLIWPNRKAAGKGESVAPLTAEDLSRVCDQSDKPDPGWWARLRADRETAVLGAMAHKATADASGETKQAAARIADELFGAPRKDRRRDPA